MVDLIKELQNKDDKAAYRLFQEMSAMSAESDLYYAYFEDFVGLLTNKSSYVRTRGFCLACAQVRWDTEDKFAHNAGILLELLHDDKAITVRKCLAALHEVVLYKPELNGQIRMEIEKMDLSKYRDTMVPLIQKDMNELLKVME